MKKQTLLISHYLYLTKEERYSVAAGNTVEVIGVNIPVWFSSGKTDEPAEEVFCKYILSNSKDDFSIREFDEGFEINLPQINMKNTKKPLSQSLLDVRDGGCEEIFFKEETKIEIQEKTYKVLNYVEIKPIEVLISTLEE